MSTAFAELWRAFRQDRRAVTALEYGLIASMVTVSIAMFVDMLGRHLVRVFTLIVSSL